jgi:hypothetical protein
MHICKKFDDGAREDPPETPLDSTSIGMERAFLNRAFCKMGMGFEGAL